MITLKDDGTSPATGAQLIQPNQLGVIMPTCPSDKLGEYAWQLSLAASERDITTPARLAAWLAQLAHESGGLRYWTELSDGRAYEGREDLGNTQPGDGPRFKGRGPIQITGRNNYREASKALGIDLVEHPERAAESLIGCRVAAWFWQSRKLNELAGVGTPLSFREITRRINGAATDGSPSHHLQRVAFWERAKAVLG